MRHQVFLVSSFWGHFLVRTVLFHESFCFSRQINSKDHLKERTTHFYCHPLKELFWKGQFFWRIGHQREVKTQFANCPSLEGKLRIWTATCFHLIIFVRDNNSCYLFLNSTFRKFSLLRMRKTGNMPNIIRRKDMEITQNSWKKRSRLNLPYRMKPLA